MDCATAVAAVWLVVLEWIDRFRRLSSYLLDACGDSGPVLGCTDDTADNYNASATEDDGSCIFRDVCVNYLLIIMN